MQITSIALADEDSLPTIDLLQLLLRFRGHLTAVHDVIPNEGECADLGTLDVLGGISIEDPCEERPDLLRACYELGTLMAWKGHHTPASRIRPT